MGKLIKQDCEQCFFDALNREYIELIGTTARYFILNKETSSRDPLYDEPITREYIAQDEDGIGLNVFVQHPESEPQAGEVGFQKQVDAVLTLARKEWEVKIAAAGLTVGEVVPKYGDILKFWDQEWDIDEIDTRGELNDTSTITRWEIQVKRRTRFLPDRKVDI